MPIHGQWRALLSRGSYRELEIFGECPFCGVFGLHFMPSRLLQRYGTDSYLYLLTRRCVECQFGWHELLRSGMMSYEVEALRKRYPEGLVVWPG